MRVDARDLRTELFNEYRYLPAKDRGELINPRVKEFKEERLAIKDEIIFNNGFRIPFMYNLYGMQKNWLLTFYCTHQASC